MAQQRLYQITLDERRLATHCGQFPHDRSLQATRSVSPLRTDSRQLVSKIYWWQSAKNGIMREPEWREPTGFVWFAPAGGGNVWVDVNRRIIQNYPHGRGFDVTEFACLVPALPA